MERLAAGPAGPRMMDFRMACTCFLLALLWVISGCAGGRSALRPGGRVRHLDFREVVKKATDKVYPSVVFIKCVKETHRMGKKISQEVSGSGVLTFNSAPDF